MEITRRDFLKSAAVLPLSAVGCTRLTEEAGGEWVNDVHSHLNRTWVRRVVSVESLAELKRAIQAAKRNGQPVCIAGGRHAMGGQQFGTGAVLLDTRAMNRVLGFDERNGLVEVEAGIEWPKLVHALSQGSANNAWAIRQKQTGADRLSIGGALAANVHGRGLRLKPFVADIESFVLVNGDGEAHECSRTKNPELFRLAVGGYGLFGAVYSVKIRLARRQRVRRVVEIKNIDDLIPAFDHRIANGFLYGDFQYSIDEKSPDFLRRGVFSCYEPVEADATEPAEHKRLSPENWLNLLYLAHADRKRVFDEYSRYYLSTSGQVYWSDTHQLSDYTDEYHTALDSRLGRVRGTEMITEVYVPRHHLADFMREAADDLRNNRVEVIYGTIRLIENDDETFLPWARERYACVIFNLHVEHSAEGMRQSADAFRRLIDMAVRRGGSYFLTYHRYATREQILACYPQFEEFLRLKRKYDPGERFQSDWYQHHKRLFQRV